MKFRLLLQTAACVVFFSAPCFAQSPAVHVAISLQYADRKPPVHLSDGDFRATLNGIRVPIQLERPRLAHQSPVGRYTPTRLLVLFSSPNRFSQEAFVKLAAELNPVWRLGWQVAMERSDGEVTGYETSRAEFEHINAAPAQFSNAVQWEVAVKALDSFDGRSVLLYINDNSKDLTKSQGSLLHTAAAAQAEMLVVDGGVPLIQAQRPIGPDTSGPGGGGGFEGVDITGSMQRLTGGSTTQVRETSHEEEYEDGEYHEVSLHDAIRRAIEDACEYYDLRLRLPNAFAGDRGLANSILIVSIKAKAPVSVIGRTYGEGAQPQLRIVKR